MSGNDIALIILYMGILGWIPIVALTNGIAKIVSAFKGKEVENSGVNISITKNSDVEDSSED